MNRIQRHLQEKDYDMQAILNEYAPDDDIMNEEEEQTARIKNIIYNDLSIADKNIILLYTELGTIRKVAKELYVSPSTAWIEIKRIQSIIKNKLKDIK